jgi:hypothetical protein
MLITKKASKALALWLIIRVPVQPVVADLLSLSNSIPVSGLGALYVG